LHGTLTRQGREALLNDEPLAGQPPPGRILSPGAVLAGRFRVMALLGEGAMGEVYEAEDLELGERVAVKVLRPEIAWDERVLKRFKREIQLARKVTHPHVCRVFDLFFHRFGGEKESGAALAFVTMELLAGETLEERLARSGRMSAAEIVPLVRQMAEGLEAAHRAGVVHRDFKSGNVMLTPAPDGSPGGLRAMVTDFGLAWSSSGSASLTTTGVMVGSPAYMAPEQVRGEEVTAATDIYALGVVLYEMATGSLPFSAETAFGTAIKRLREPPTLPRRHAPDLDPRLESVILRCLESDPGERFATPGEVAAALEQAAAPATERRRRHVRWRAVAVAAALVAAAGLAVWVVATERRSAGSPGDIRPAGAVRSFDSSEALPENAYIGESLYAEGLARRARFDPKGARQLLEQARDADPDNPLIRAELAVTLAALGYDAQAREEGAEAFERAAALPSGKRRLVEARYREVTRDWELAAEIYQDLWASSPTDFEHGLFLARVQIQAGQHDKALETVERLRATPSPSPDPRTDLVEAEAALRQNDVERGMIAATRAVTVATAQKAVLIAARGLHFQGIALRLSGRLDDARQTSERAARLFREAGDPVSEADALNNVGGSLLTQGEVEGARRTFERVVEIGGEVGSSTVRAMGLTNLGGFLLQTGDLEGARARYDQAAVAYREAGKRDLEAQVLNNLGLINLRLGRRAEARAMFSEVVRVFQELGNPGREGVATENLGHFALEEGNLREARRHFTRALQLHRRVNNFRGIALSQAGLAQALFLIGDLPGARRELEMGITTLESLGASPLAAQNRLVLARFLVDSGDLDGGEAMARQAETRLTAGGQPDDVVLAQTILAAVALERGKAGEALAAMERLAAPLAKCQNDGIRRYAAVIAALARAEQDPRGAAQRLTELAEHAEQSGLRPAALEIRLALGEIEMDGLDPAAGRVRVAAVQRAARAAGLGGLLRQAAEALRKP